MSFFKKKQPNIAMAEAEYDPLDLGAQTGEPTPEGDLGLSSLADDQLLTLAEQARMEIWSRGFAIFQNIWLSSVKRQDEEFKDRTEAWLQAQLNYRQSRFDALVEDATSNLNALAKQGLIKAAFSPEEEKLIQSVATLDAKLAMIDAFRLKAAEEASRAHQSYASMTHTAYFGGGPSPTYRPSGVLGSPAYRPAYGPRK